MAATPLTTVLEIRNFTGADETTVPDSLIEKFINDAEDFIEEKTGKRFEATEVIDEVHDGNGENWMHLDHYPVISLTKVEIDGTEYEDTSLFYLYKDTGLIRLRAGVIIGGNIFTPVFSVGFQNIKFSYTYGDPEYKIADEIAFKMACIMTLICMGIKESGGIISEKLGTDYSLSYGSSGPYAGLISMLQKQIQDGLDTLGVPLDYRII